MNSDKDNETKIFRNSIAYLNKVCDQPSLNVSALKSLYSTKCMLHELRQRLHLAPAVSGRVAYERCQRCCIKFSDGFTLYRVEQSRRKTKSKQPRRKMEEHCNKLVIQCGFCKKEIKFSMKKPTKMKVGEKNILPQKKSKKKDKFCGLNKNAVFAASSGSTDTSADFIPLKSTLGDVKNQTKKEATLLANIKKGKSRMKTTKTTMEKLNDMIAKSRGTAKSSSSNLKHFLQDL